ncbi:MAG: MFS transporter [Bacteroidetes bacterium]|nr:MFS transporter [Bacteroidota bacterium]
MENIKKSHLFNASCVALVVTALTFATRAGMIDPWREEFNLTAEQVGWIIGTAFWGFTVAMVLGGPLVDIVGMKRIIYVAFICHVAGILLTIFATGFSSLFISTLLIGIANGSVEAATNPLIAGMHTDDKTKKLNQFHVWFPGGIVIGGLMVFALEALGYGWRLQMAAMLIPTVLYGFMFLGLKFPQTERVSAGYTYKDMLKAVVSPLFLFMAACMIMTAATELGSNQWMTALLEDVMKSEGIHSILLLVWISGIMAVGRSVAGPIVHRLSPSGVLLGSAIFSGIGLLLLSYAGGYWSFGAAAVFAVGITYFWPTMLGFVNENIPKSGALGFAIMGGIGFLGGAIAQPVLGRIYDIKFEVLNNSLAAGSATLRTVIVLTVILTIAFSYLYFRRRSQKTNEA